MESNTKNLEILEAEIKAIVQSNKDLIERIEALKINQKKLKTTNHIIKVKPIEDPYKIREPLSIYCEEETEEETISDYITNWVIPKTAEKPEEVDPDKIINIEDKDLMNMKCEHYEDLVRIKQQISAAVKYLNLLRESASYAFGLKFKKNFEFVGKLLKNLLSSIDGQENFDQKALEIKGKVLEINNLFLKLFDSNFVLNSSKVQISIESKILTKPTIKMLDQMFKKKMKFSLIHDSNRGVAKTNFLNGKSSIIVIIKNTLDYVFGAYIADKFGSPGGWIEGSKETFLFTFGTTNAPRAIKLLHSGGQGIYISGGCGLHLSSDLNAFCSNSCSPSVYKTIIFSNPN